MAMLPVFPAPYPEECFYSILSRAFIRNGYLSDAEFIITLFGKHMNMRHMILTPYGVHHCSHWVPPGSGITAGKLLLDHTCAQYGVLPSHPSVISKIRNETVNGISNPFHAVSRMIRFRTQSFADHLRFCPLCILEDAEKYGEPYWHRIHQIRETVYCPTHSVPILNSSVPLLSYLLTGNHFFPASYVMDDLVKGGLEMAGALIDSARPKMPACRELHLILDKDIQFLLSNGFSLSETRSLFERFKSRLDQEGTGGDAEANRLVMEQKLHEHFNPEFQKLILGFSHYAQNFYKFIDRKKEYTNTPYLPTVMCVLGMECLSGSAEAFYHETEKR